MSGTEAPEQSSADGIPGTLKVTAGLTWRVLVVLAGVVVVGYVMNVIFPVVFALFFATADDRLVPAAHEPVPPLPAQSAVDGARAAHHRRCRRRDPGQSSSARASARVPSWWPPCRAASPRSSSGSGPVRCTSPTRTSPTSSPRARAGPSPSPALWRATSWAPSGRSAHWSSRARCSSTASSSSCSRRTRSGTGSSAGCPRACRARSTCPGTSPGTPSPGTRAASSSSPSPTPCSCSSA